MSQWSPPAQASAATGEICDFSQTHVFGAESVESGEPDLSAGNQREPFIAVDPNPGEDGIQAFAFAIGERPAPGNDPIASYTRNSGADWFSRRIATGNEIPEGLADPGAVFTSHGTLFISYLYDPSFQPPQAKFPQIEAGTRPVIIAMSDNQGESFSLVDALGGTQESPSSDRPSLATGPGGANGTLWVIHDDSAVGGPIAVAGAALDANGAIPTDACGQGLGSFCNPSIIADRSRGSVYPGHVAVGPDGEVLATFMRTIPPGPTGTMTEIFAVLDPDGIGGTDFPNYQNDICPPSAGVMGGLEPINCIGPVTTTGVLWIESFPPSGGQISPLANLAWDRNVSSSRPFGRVYLVTTIEKPPESNDTDIALFASDDRGASWTGPVIVNSDSDGTSVPPPDEVRSQFLPHVEVDQSTGDVVIVWYDPRRDDGETGGSDATPNNEYEVFIGLSQDGGQTFENKAISIPRRRRLCAGVLTCHGCRHAARLPRSRCSRRDSVRCVGRQLQQRRRQPRS